jgi:hypothetical protein
MIQDLRIDGQMIATYLALSSYADREGLAYPGLPAIAKRARLGTTAAREAIRRLEALGVVGVTPRRAEDGSQSSNLYRISVHTPPPPGVGTPLRQAWGAPPSGVDEQDPLNNNHSTPLQAPQGAEPIDGLEAPPVAEPNLFDTFWAQYPRKVGKPQAQRAWLKALKSGVGPLHIIGAAMAYAEDPNREAAFTAHPSTWLNREGWNDGPLPERAPGFAEVKAMVPAVPPAPERTMSERVIDCAQVGRAHRPLADGTCMLCETRITG